MKPALISLSICGACFAATWVAAAEGSTNSPALYGFTRENASNQVALEARFDAAVSKENLKEWMRRLSARPHHLGSPADKEAAEFIAAQFRSWGYQTSIEEFQVLFPTPKSRLLEMTAPAKFTATLAEPSIPEDSTSSLAKEGLPTYNAYSIDGDVTGQLVYVNYGVQKDYEALAEHGIDVKGKIVIARYGAGIWRGIRPKTAAEHGATGCLIYSDPRDDGYFEGDMYPKGPWRSEQGAQRGSVTDIPLYPGDPLTPGVGATKDAKRLALKDAPVLTKIPVLPISYGDALPLLRALGGPLAPKEWRGALPITYHLGPGPATVHLKLEFNWDQVPARDVIARLPGAEEPEQWVMRGNHYDGWVFGAEDPISGTVVLMEEARVLSELGKQGWKPRRSVVFTVWDGEEPGLLGSTEWAEEHAAEVAEHAAVYINTDANHRGFLGAAGSPSLERFVNELTDGLTDPERHVPVATRLRDRDLVKAKADERAEIRGRKGFLLDALGSGSDFTPFLQHLGIASLDIGYGDEENGGAYHSIYDSFDHFTRFDDPTFDYEVLLARTSGRAVLRLADADVLPFGFPALASHLSKYVKEVVKLADDLRAETRETNELLKENAFLAVADPHDPYRQPPPKSEVPFLNFAPLQNASARVSKSAGAFETAMHPLMYRHQLLVQTGPALDRALMKLEAALTDPAGLPHRPWYRHVLYAPGIYTGYSAKTLPSVREAIEQRNWSEAEEQIGTTARTLEKFADALDAAAKLIPANQ